MPSNPIINLRSDTATAPTPAMRRAMAEAPVGDEQRREDPTVNQLQERVATLLGAEAAVYLPSATMANQIAFAVHLEGGDDLLGHRLSHPFNFEAGGPAYLSRAMIQPLEGARGMFTAQALEAAIRPGGDYHRSRSRCVLVENTTNLGGGGVWPIEQVEEVAAAARKHGLARHLDGSRLMNAVVASGTSAAEYASRFDSITLCFSKGLGAPVGAALAGSAEFISKAWRFKHMFGGAMRQAGVIAAAALYGLEHHVERLAEDHANARRLAEALDGIAGLHVDVAHVETNIILLEIDPGLMTAAALSARMAERGVWFGPIGAQSCRLVTHLDVSGEMIDGAIGRFREAL